MQPRQPPGVASANLSEKAARPRCRSASVEKHEHRNYGLRVGAYRQEAQPHYYSERRNLALGAILASVRR